MVPDDIFKALATLNVPPEKIEEFKAKMKDFESTEQVLLKEKKRKESKNDFGTNSNFIGRTKQKTSKNGFNYDN